MSTITYLEALVRAQLTELQRDPDVFLMGEDIRSGIYGQLSAGVDPERVRNTPISEAGFVGAGIGAAMTGLRPVVDLGCTAFIYCAMDQIVSQAAKNRYLFGGQARIPIVIRAAMYYGGAGLASHHADRPYPMFMNMPGLKVITPATPYDACGLLRAAIRDDDPVLCFEDTTLWSSKGEVPDDDYTVALGTADVKRAGDDVTVVGVAGGVSIALQAAHRLAAEGVSVEVVDPRTLVPLDRRTILASVVKTGRLVVVDPANRTCGAAAEVAALAAEEAFEHLLAPVVRVTTPDTHIPFSPVLERPLYPDADKVAAAVRYVARFDGSTRLRAAGAPLQEAGR